MSQQTPDPAVFRFLNEIGIFDQLARYRVERTLPHGLKISQFSVLNHFVRLGDGWTPSRLASAFQVTKGAMTNTLHRLGALEFVDIVPAEGDGRSKLVRITEAGRAAHRDCIAAMSPDLATLQNEFGSKNFNAAIPFLEQVRSYLDENR